jgi:predicted nuclease of predicted toxin-antitoxin system
MNFLVDENLPREVAGWLNNAGHAARHVSEASLLGQSDSAVWAYATSINAWMITRDADFLAIAARSTTGGVVRLLIGNCSAPVLLARMGELWPDVEARLGAGERIIEIG